MKITLLKTRLLSMHAITLPLAHRRSDFFIRCNGQAVPGMFSDPPESVRKARPLTDLLARGASHPKAALI
jgi:hypothetical protein